MLSSGSLVKPIDIFDLLMHGTPWLLLAAKGVVALVVGKPKANSSS